MAHFAELNENNKVLRVIVIHNNELLDENGNEQEHLGVSFCRSLFGENTIWIQTSYNANFRKNYAGTGYTYDNQRDAFIAEKPYESWILNEETCEWIPPVPIPDETKPYYWNDPTQEWLLYNIDKQV